VAAVEHHVDCVEVVAVRVVGDAAHRGGQRDHRHCLWPGAPGLIGMLVDVAVIARQVAAAVHFENELCERGFRPGGPDRHDSPDQIDELKVATSTAEPSRRVTTRSTSLAL